MVLRIIKFILLAYLVAFTQTILASLTSIRHIAPDYGMIIILLVMLRNEFPVAHSAAFLASIVMDALNPELFGFGTLIRFAIAAAVYELRKNLNVERILSRVYVLIGAESIFHLLYQLVANSFDMSSVTQIYLETSLPTLAYTTVVGTAVLFLLDLEIKLEIKRRRHLG